MADQEMNLIDHLDELRKRLIITIIAFLVFFGFGFAYVKDIYHWFVRDLNVKLIVLGPGDIIWVYFMIATVVGIAGTIPVLAFQIWSFVKPALRPFEKKVTLSYIPALFILFIVGLCFGYFVVFPTILKFIVGLGGDMVVTNFTAEKYFGFIANITLPLGCFFTLPVIVMFLTSLGIMNPNVLKKVRKFAYLILVIVASMITPPDFVSHISVSIPLILLYEISVSLSKVVYKRKLKKEQEYLKEHSETGEFIE